MNDLVKDAVKLFAELLDRRIDKGVPTTEDSVRYTFYAALMAHGKIQPEQVVMEFPHPQIARAEVDTLLLDSELRPSVAIEFKYDREIPSGRNAPRPQRAGAVFGDLVRLLALTSVESRLLVHLSTEELARYWREPKNGLSTVFGMRQSMALEISDAYFAGRSVTFRESMGLWPGPAVLLSVLSQSLSRGHELRVYEIELGRLEV